MEKQKEKPIWLRIILFLVIAGGLTVAITVLGTLLYLPIVMRIPQEILVASPNPFLKTVSLYLSICGWFIAAVLIFLIIKPFRPYLTCLSGKCKGNNWKIILLGALLGLGLNSLDVLFAVLHGEIELSFHEFNFLYCAGLLPIVVLQSLGEEIVARVVILQTTAKYFKNPALIIGFNCIPFALIHLRNDGATIVGAVGLFFLALLAAVLVYYTDSFWAAGFMHGMWNFSQAIIWGLPNSGNRAAYSIFKLNEATAKDGLFYSTTFGPEGGIMATVFLGIAAAIIIYWGVRNHKKMTNIWE